MSKRENERTISDRAEVLKAVKREEYVMEFLDESLLNDREFILECFKQNINAFHFVDDSLKKDREFILKAITQNGRAFHFVDETLKKDREFMLQVVKQNGNAILHVDESLKKDREFVLEAVKLNTIVVLFLDDSLRKDREFISEIVKILGKPIDSVKKDREIVLGCVKQNGNAILYADESLKKDREIVLAAVRQHGRILEYVDESFKKDREIVLEAFKENENALNYAEGSLRKDILFVYSIFKLDVKKARIFSMLALQIENSNLFKKLSKDILEQVSKNFIDESDLYYCIELGSIFEPKTKSTILNLNPLYSSKFITKLLIFQILKQMNDEELTSNDISPLTTTNYYLFCFRLDKFIEDKTIQPSRPRDSKIYVEKLVSNFKTDFYSKQEIKEILNFAYNWLDNEKNVIGHNYLPKKPCNKIRLPDLNRPKLNEGKIFLNDKQLVKEAPQHCRSTFICVLMAIMLSLSINSNFSLNY